MTSKVGADRDMAALDEFIATVASRTQREIARVTAARPAAALARAGGKHLRARLLWLSAAAVVPRAQVSRSESILRAATAIELAHLGSLIHDDIVDGATTRRGVPCVHLLWGTTAAYRAGTALLHLASALVGDFPTECRASLARAVLAMCRGQVRELVSLFRPCRRGERLGIVREKTAALLEATASMGVTVVGGSKRHADALQTFARALGVAYQIKDDLMDLVGDPVRLGRANGADLWDGVMTLPVLIARERSRTVASMLQRIRTESEEADVAECIRLIAASGAVEAATGQAQRWAAAASHALHSVVMDEVAQASLAAFAQHLTRVEIGNRVVVETPIRAGKPVPLQFRALDAPGVKVQASHTYNASRDDGDSLILRRLAWIEPTLAEMIFDLMQLTSQSCQTVQRTVSVSITAELRAIELAGSVASRSALEHSPITCVAAADCLEAVAFACLADSCNEVHARVEEMYLNGLRMSDHSSRGRPETIHGTPSPP